MFPKPCLIPFIGKPCEYAKYPPALDSLYSSALLLPLWKGLKNHEDYAYISPYLLLSLL